LHKHVYSNAKGNVQLFISLFDVHYIMMVPLFSLSICSNTKVLCFNSDINRCTELCYMYQVSTYVKYITVYCSFQCQTAILTITDISELFQ